MFGKLAAFGQHKGKKEFKACATASWLLLSQSMRPVSFLCRNSDAGRLAADTSQYKFDITIHSLSPIPGALQQIKVLLVSKWFRPSAFGPLRCTAPFNFSVRTVVGCSLARCSFIYRCQGNLVIAGQIRGNKVIATRPVSLTGQKAVWEEKLSVHATLYKTANGAWDEKVGTSSQRAPCTPSAPPRAQWLHAVAAVSRCMPSRRSARWGTSLARNRSHLPRPTSTSPATRPWTQIPPLPSWWRFL